MTAAGSEPVLSEDELSQLLEGYALPDSQSRVPSDLNWVPTYDLNAAAAEGWRWKAARASEMTAIDLDGTKLSADQLFAHCEKMAVLYARKVKRSVSFA